MNFKIALEDFICIFKILFIAAQLAVLWFKDANMTGTYIFSLNSLLQIILQGPQAS